MKLNILPVRTRCITKHSTLLPRWDITPSLPTATVNPIMDSRIPRLLHLLCTPTRSRLLSMWSHTVSELHTRPLHDGPSGRLLILLALSLQSVPSGLTVGCSRQICCVYCQCCCLNVPPSFWPTDYRYPFAPVDLTPSLLSVRLARFAVYIRRFLDPHTNECDRPCLLLFSLCPSVLQIQSPLLLYDRVNPPHFALFAGVTDSHDFLDFRR